MAKATVKKAARNSKGNERALSDLRSALSKLSDARDAAQVIEDGRPNAQGFDHQALARFSRMGIDEAGRDLEQALCDLGLIPDCDYGFFVQDLKREGMQAKGVKHA